MSQTGKGNLDDHNGTRDALIPHALRVRLDRFHADLWVFRKEDENLQGIPLNTLLNRCYGNARSG